MTDHPDTEALSAYLDGEAPEWDAHVAGCARCRDEVERLRAVAVAVGQAVIAPAAVDRDRAIAQALSRAADARGVGAAEATFAEPPPLAPPPVPVRTSASRRPARPVWVAVGSVAAALLAVVGALSLVNRNGDGGGGGGTTALEAERDNDETTADSPAATALGSDRVVDGGDLGELPDDRALAADVLGAVAATDTRFSGAADDRSPAAAPPSVGDQAPASPTEGATAEADRPPAPAEPRIVGTRACELQAREADPALREVIYAATGQQDGVPVVVLGFALPPGDDAATATPRLKVMVLSQTGCRLLSQTVAR